MSIIDNDITEFCQLVKRINKLSSELQKEERLHYSGGSSFEECNSMYIQELTEYQNRLKTLIKNICK